MSEDKQYKHLEEVFMESDIVFQCKQMDYNALNDFLSRDDNLERLLEYAIRPQEKSYCPIEVEDLTLRDKFPYVAGEIIRSTVGRRVLMEKITTSSHFLNILYSILDEPEPNCFYGKQFVRIITSFCKNDPTKLSTYRFIYAEGASILKKMLRCVHLPMMDTLVLLCLNYEDPDEEVNRDFEERKDSFVDLMIDSLGTPDAGVSENTSRLIFNMLQMERPNTATTMFFAKMRAVVDSVVRLFDGQSPCEFGEVAKVLERLCINPPEHPKPLEELLGYGFPKFVELLQTEDTIRPWEASPGKIIPLGLPKLSLCRIFSALISRFRELQQKHEGADLSGLIIQSGCLPVVVRVFFKYENSDIMHAYVMAALKEILRSGDVALCACLLNECKLGERLIRCYEEQHKRDSKNTTMAFVWELAFSLEDMTGSGTGGDGDGSSLDDLKASGFHQVRGYEAFQRQLALVHFVHRVYRCGGDVTIPSVFEKRLPRAEFPTPGVAEDEEEEGETSSTRADIVVERRGGGDEIEGFWDSEELRRKEKIDDFSFFLSDD